MRKPLKSDAGKRKRAKRPAQRGLREPSFNARAYFAVFCLAVGSLGLFARAIYLQVVDEAFLGQQADARHIRSATLSAHRGTITDRNGEVLAVSTPVDSIWVNPGVLVASPEQIPALAKALGMSAADVNEKVSRNAGKEFLWLNRHMNPDDAARVLAMEIPGVYVQREYRRYYPAGEVTGHLLGFTNIDDNGQEGLELAFDHKLAGEPGMKKVLKDRLGRYVEDIESVKAPVHGQDIVTSIDLRMQYFAYRALQSAVKEHRAKSGSAVVVDVRTGEVLAMVNQPTYNPNNRASFSATLYRNRAITDILEPGSAIKPLVIAAALESGQYRENSFVDTEPGYVLVGSKKIIDKHNLGRINLETVLQKSSNVGVTKVAMSLEPDYLWSVLTRFGLGQSTASGFPGESAGLLSHYSNWREISQATLAYGYGLSMTPLQLAQAYAVLGAQGLQHPASLLKVEQAPISRRIVQPETAASVLRMMESVVQTGGTGTQAAIAGYRIAGKTGTSRKASAGGYAEDRYAAVFAGLAPASNPRLAIVVVVDEPNAGEYYGGQVAAPVFSSIASGSLRIMAVAPDNVKGDKREALRLAEAGR
jgi:cell division protein FtsI (penicillin-binding protein 3)